MSNSIESIISHANSLLQNQQGFCSCSLHATHHVLAYEFATGQDAELFKSQRLAIADSTGLKYQIRDSQPNLP